MGLKTPEQRSHDDMIGSHEPRKKKNGVPYFTLNPCCLVGLLIMVYEIFPIKLGSISSPLYPKQLGFFFISHIFQAYLYVPQAGRYLTLLLGGPPSGNSSLSLVKTFGKWTALLNSQHKIAVLNEDIISHSSTSESFLNCRVKCSYWVSSFQ